MTLSIDDDLDVFFDDDEFSTSATLDGSAISAIYDTEYQSISDGVVMQTDSPSVLVQSSDYPSHVDGTSLVLDGTTYRVMRREPMDDGKLCRLILTEVT